MLLEPPPWGRGALRFRWGGPPSPPHVSTTASQSVHATPSLSPWCVGGSGLFPRVSRWLGWAVLRKFIASENWNRIRLLIGREMIKSANMKYWGSFLNSRDVRTVVPSCCSDCSRLWLPGPVLGGGGCWHQCRSWRPRCPSQLVGGSSSAASFGLKQCPSGASGHLFLPLQRRGPVGAVVLHP